MAIFGKKKNNNKNFVVIGISATNVFLVANDEKSKSDTLGLLFESRSAMDNSEKEKVIVELLTVAKVTKKTNVKVLLYKDLYNSIQIDKPNAPEEEISGAIQWAIKDFVQESVNNLAIDYIDMPKSPSYPNDKVLVVSVPKTLVKMIAKSVTQMAILDSITVEELAFAELYDENDEDPHLVLFQPNGSELMLITILKSRLFFSRVLRGFKDLGKYQKGSLDNEFLDNMSLDVQRSIDYIVGQLKLPTPKKLTLILDCPDVEKIADYMKTSFFLDVDNINEEIKHNSVVYAPLFAIKNGKINKNENKN